MRTDPKTRRQFLIGAGRLSLALPLPVLPSLLPREARAAATASPPIRFLHCLHVWNQFGSTFYPQGLTLQTLDAANNVKGAPLSAINGPISKVINSAFDPLRPKMNIIKGLHCLTGNGNHNTSKPTCGSGSPNGDPAKPPFPWSVENILSNSSKVYPNGESAGISRFLGLTHRRPAYDKRNIQDGFAWSPTGRMPILTDPAAVYSKFMGSFNQKVIDPTTDPEVVARINVMDDVFQDFKAVSGSSQISSTDKVRLDNYATLISEVRSKLSKPVMSCSSDPKPSGDVSVDGNAKDLVNLAAAAMACQLSNVIDFVISPDGTPQMHTLEHNNVVGQYSDVTVLYGKTFASLWSKLDEMKDPDGKTVLDNSLVAWVTSEGLDVAHSEKNMPLVIAGNAGGRIRTGYYLDYGARPYNNWLVTILNTFGIDAPEYEKIVGQVGFGEYKAAAATSYGVSAFLTDSEKRKPLPFIYNQG